MKPFDLEKALAGEPVKLRNGLKAYVKYQIPEEFKQKYPLRGFYVIPHPNNSIAETEAWTLEGGCFDDVNYINERDIIGMWEEPKPKRYVNGIEISMPLKPDDFKDGTRYWFVDFSNMENVTYDYFYKYSTVDKKLISQGLVFETKEGAKTMAKALLNYKVETK